MEFTQQRSIVLERDYKNRCIVMTIIKDVYYFTPNNNSDNFVKKKTRNKILGHYEIFKRL